MSEIDFSVMVGDRQVIAGGSVMLHGANTVTFKVADLTFVIEFQSSGERKLRADLGERTEKKSNFVLYNFDNTFGSSWSTDVGVINSRKLRMDLFVRSLTTENRSQRLVHYAFSLGEKVDA